MGLSSYESILNIVNFNITEGRLILLTIAILLFAITGAMLANGAKSLPY